MRAIELESWVLRLLERVEKRVPIEDSKVEIKSEWLDPVRAARRIAAHANAARGENILWLIGVDEKQGIIKGANYQDLANWWPQVKACFESEIPTLQDLNVQYNGKTIAALCFDTSRLPYVIKNSNAGEIQYEVPWREGTATRSARRSDLVLMLAPLVRIPKAELITGELSFDTGAKHEVIPYFRFKLSAYVVPYETPVYFPIHKCSAVIASGGQVLADSFSLELLFPPVTAPTDSIVVTEDELTVRGAGKIILHGAYGHTTRYSGQDDIELTVTLVEAISDQPITLWGRFSRDKRPDSEPNQFFLVAK